MDIHHVEPSELPQMLKLLEAKAEFDGCRESMVASVDSLREAMFCEQPLAHALVAQVEDRLVGMATYFTIFSSFIARPGLWLDDLYVIEPFRGQLIGRKLMHRLSELAVHAGCGRVDWHVSALNERGISFYQGLGATVSPRARLVRLDADAIRRLTHEQVGT